ncbi:hypothetical protein [Sphingomonas sp. 28-63-12]|uniref:hypothetical protein n=1 Tax=Sphingomonas sp. 28-63-12 TaxID=1970434 RepID=UPI0035A8D9F3
MPEEPNDRKWWKAVVRNVGRCYTSAMAFSDLPTRLATILSAEEAPAVDWPAVDRLCDELDRDLEASGDDIPEIVAHFLSDSDIRARDASYGEAQRDAIRTYLATGDYFDGVAVPWWGCLALVVGVVGGLIAWALA